MYDTFFLSTITLSHLFLEGEPVGGSGSLSAVVPVAIDGLPAPAPEVLLVVVVSQHQLDVQATDALRPLLQESLATHELDVFLEFGIVVL